jgi:hypothetical protein
MADGTADGIGLAMGKNDFGAAKSEMVGLTGIDAAARIGSITTSSSIKRSCESASRIAWASISSPSLPSSWSSSSSSSSSDEESKAVFIPFPFTVDAAGTFSMMLEDAAGPVPTSKTAGGAGAPVWDRCALIRCAMACLSSVALIQLISLKFKKIFDDIRIALFTNSV